MSTTVKAVFTIAAVISIPLTIALKGIDALKEANNTNVNALSGEAVQTPPTKVFEGPNGKLYNLEDTYVDRTNEGKPSTKLEKYVEQPPGP